MTITIWISLGLIGLAVLMAGSIVAWNARSGATPSRFTMLFVGGSCGLMFAAYLLLTVPATVRDIQGLFQ